MLLIGVTGGILCILLSILIFSLGLLSIFAGEEQTLLFISSLYGVIIGIMGIVAGVKAENFRLSATVFFTAAGVSTIVFFTAANVSVISFIFSFPYILFGILFAIGAILGVSKQKNSQRMQK